MWANIEDVWLTCWSFIVCRTSFKVIMQTKTINFVSGSTHFRKDSSYLNSRDIKMKINSTPFTHTSGVPQGSILGPLLFIIFSNDIVNVIPDCQKLIYTTVSDTADCLRLQNCLSNFNSWYKLNSMSVNIKKMFCDNVRQKKIPYSLWLPNSWQFSSADQQRSRFRCTAR